MQGPPAVALRLLAGAPDDREARAEWMRKQLATGFTIPHDALAFEREPRGKPKLRPPHGHCAFSVAYRPGLWLLGMARDRRVGVDIEPIDPCRPWQTVARSFFRPEEARLLAGLPPEQGRRAFFAAWVIKEAVLKAIGCGITAGLAIPRLDGDLLRALAQLDRAGIRASGQLAEVRAFEISTGAPGRMPPVLAASATVAHDRLEPFASEVLMISPAA